MMGGHHDPADHKRLQSCAAGINIRIAASVTHSLPTLWCVTFMHPEYMQLQSSAAETSVRFAATVTYSPPMFWRVMHPDFTQI